MEKWKIGAIALLLAGFAGFAATQNKPPIASPETAHSEGDGHDHEGEHSDAAPAPESDPKVAALIGTEPPAWSIPANLWANTKKPLTPADLKGKVTLLEFFRIGCPHCEDAVPFIEAMQKQYGPRGLQIITFQSPGVLTDSSNPELNWNTVQSWLKERDVTYPAAFDSGRALKNKTGITTYPLSLVVGKDGKIVYGQTGHTQQKAQALASKIEETMSNK